MSKVIGGPQVVEALRALGKSTGKNVLRRVGREALEPMAEDARAHARRRSGNMAGSIVVGKPLAKSQRAARGANIGGGQFRASRKDNVQVYMGPGQHPQAITEEFGKFNQAAHPFMRPAFDANADGVIDRVGDGLWPAINKAAQRAAKKAARLLAKGGGK